MGGVAAEVVPCPQRLILDCRFVQLVDSFVDARDRHHVIELTNCIHVCFNDMPYCLLFSLGWGVAIKLDG